jgi:two-component system phosphate regulon sensor histidine kinase PhoR
VIRLSRIWKFYILSTALFVVLVTAVGFVLQAELKKELKAQLEEQVFTLAKVLASVLPATTDPAILTPWCRHYRELTKARLTIIEKDGKVVGDSSGDSIVGENHGGRPEILSAAEAGMATAVRYSETLKADMFYAALFLKEQGRTIRLALPMTEVRAIENEVMFFFALALYFIPILAMFISFLFTRYVVRDRSDYRHRSDSRSPLS